MDEDKQTPPSTPVGGGMTITIIPNGTAPMTATIAPAATTTTTSGVTSPVTTKKQ